ncbi:MAG: hypothetical protein Q9218_002015 [Villophora microphyllina]
MTQERRMLLRAARDASRQSPVDYNSITVKLLEEHLHAGKCITSPKILHQFTRDVATDFEELSKILDSAPKTDVKDFGYEDRVISVGEKLSARLLAALLEDRGIPSQYVDFSDVIDFPIPEHLSPQFYQDLSSCFSKHLLACKDRVPVITGFFGRIPGGLVNTLGRGYSDLCAALVSVALQAIELQVWKEVDGVFTADPRKVPTARLLPTLTAYEASELTFYGSEVIHNLTLQQLGGPRIPIRIKNVLRPHSAGTIVHADDLNYPAKPSSSDESNHRSKQASSNDPNYPSKRTPSNDRSQKGAAYRGSRPNRPTAVTVKQPITVVNVRSNRKVGLSTLLTQTFRIMEANNIEVDLMEKSECNVSLAVHAATSYTDNEIVDTAINPGSGQSQINNKFQIKDEDLRAAVKELEDYGVVDVVHDMATLSLIGTGLKRSVGIAGKLFTALGDNNINIEMISQGASEISIATVIEAREARRALNVVHSELFTYLD